MSARTIVSWAGAGDDCRIAPQWWQQKRGLTCCCGEAAYCQRRESTKIWTFGLAISAATCRGAKCPTLKTAEKQWVTVKQPKNSRKNSRNTEISQNSCFSGVSAVFPAVFRLRLQVWAVQAASKGRLPNLLERLAVKGFPRLEKHSCILPPYIYIYML